MTELNSNRQMYRQIPDLDPVVVPAEEQHLSDVRDLWMARFGGDDDVVDGWLDESIDEDVPTEAFVALDGGNVIGFGVATICNPDYAQKYVALDVPDFPPDGPAGILHMNVVDDDRVSEGIGTQLFKARLRYLRAICDVDYVFGISWHRETSHDSRALFEKFDFNQLGTWDRYYDRAYGRDNCPDCGGECSCTASIYARTFTTPWRGDSCV